MVQDVIKFGYHGDKKNSFMSNYFRCKILYDGVEYSNSEAFYQSMKFNQHKRARYGNIPPNVAKALGNSTRLPPNEVKKWDKRKDTIMELVVFEKFKQNPKLLEKLINTGNSFIIEDTTGWNDKYWGQADGVGKNMLGKIIVKVRTILQNNPNITCIYDEKTNELTYK